MWAYHYENMIYKARYGTNPMYGRSNWFRSEILTALEEGGVTRAQIFASLKPSVTSVQALKDELIYVCPAKKALITNTFKKYGK